MRSKADNDSQGPESESQDGASGIVVLTAEPLPPAFGGQRQPTGEDLSRLMQQAVQAWLHKTPSLATRTNYARDLSQFLDFHGIPRTSLDELTDVLPSHVAAWRDHLQSRRAANSTIRRKLTALRSLFSYLQVYGYTGANPAHGKFVQAPAVPRDGKTVGLSPRDCRRLLEAPDRSTPAGIRDRALLGVLAARLGQS